MIFFVNYVKFYEEYKDILSQDTELRYEKAKEILEYLKLKQL